MQELKILATRFDIPPQQITSPRHSGLNQGDFNNLTEKQNSHSPVSEGRKVAVLKPVARTGLSN